MPPYQIGHTMSNATLPMPVQFAPSTARVPFPMVTTRAMWTPADLGEVDGDIDKQPQFRFRRHIVAVQATALAYGLPIDSVWLPCHVCGYAVDAWQADRDHAHAMARGGTTGPHNLILTHKKCNRTYKGDWDASEDVINVLKKNAPLIIALKGMRRANGGTNARILHDWWYARPRLEN